MTDEVKNVEDLTIDEMAKMMNDGVTDAELEEAEPEVTQPEAEAEPDEVTEEVEGEPDEPAPTEPSGEDEAVAPDDEPESEASLDLQEINARLDEAEARARHAEQTTGRFTGELGFLRQENAKLKAQLAQPPAAPDEYGDESAAPAQPTYARQQDSPALIALTLKQAALEFAAAHPDIAENGSFKPEFLAAVQPQMQSVLDYPDALEASKHLTQILSTEHSRLDVANKAAAREAVEKKRTDQAATLKARKRAASVSADGKPAPAKAKPKTPDDMSVDELAKAIDAQE